MVKSNKNNQNPGQRAESLQLLTQKVALPTEEFGQVDPDADVRRTVASGDEADNEVEASSERSDGT